MDKEVRFQGVPLRVELRREFVAEERSAEEFRLAPVGFRGRVVLDLDEFLIIYDRDIKEQK